MYVPAANAVEDPAVMLALLRSAGVGHLVNVDSTGTLESTLLPFVVDDDLRTVRAHIARANPHWRALDGTSGLMIVPVGDAYVSPSWYESKRDDPRVVPTWNYELVHVHGTVHVRDDATFVESVVRSLTEHHEARRIDDRSERPPRCHPLVGRRCPARFHRTAVARHRRRRADRHQRRGEAQAQPEPQRRGPLGRDRGAERFESHGLPRRRRCHARRSSRLISDPGCPLSTAQR